MFFGLLYSLKSLIKVFEDVVFVLGGVPSQVIKNTIKVTR